MTPELIALLGGGFSGFIFKLIGTLVQAQQANIQSMLQKQEIADDSHDRASSRGGEWVRRLIVCVILFAVVVAPFLLAYSSKGVTIGTSNTFLFGLFDLTSYKTLDGYVILSEVRVTVSAIVGFYFGSSQLK